MLLEQGVRITGATREDYWSKPFFKPSIHAGLRGVSKLNNINNINNIKGLGVH